MNASLQLARTTLILTMQSVSNPELLSKLNQAVDAIQIDPTSEATEETVLNALIYAKICVNEKMLAGEILRAIDALKGVAA